MNIKRKLSKRAVQAFRVFFLASIITYLAGLTPLMEEVELDLYDTRMDLWQSGIQADTLDSRVKLVSIDDQTKSDGWGDHATLMLLHQLLEADVKAVVVFGSDFFDDLSAVESSLPPNVLVLDEKTTQGNELLFGLQADSQKIADIDGRVRSLPSDHPSMSLVALLMNELGVGQFKPHTGRLFLEFEPRRDISNEGSYSDALTPSSIGSFRQHIQESKIARRELAGSVILMSRQSQSATNFQINSPMDYLQPSQLYACALNTYLDGWNLRVLGPGWGVFINSLLIALVSFGLSGRRPVTIAVSGTLLLVSLMVLSLFLFPLMVDIGVAQLILATLTALVLLTFLEFRRTSRVLQSFGGIEDAKIDAQETDASILFTELPDFLLEMERRGDQNLLERRADYTTLILNIARKYHGRVLDFQGDAQMIGFGLRHDTDQEHSAEATAAALEIVSAVPLLSEAWDLPADQLRVHAGICTGPVALGHVVAAGKQDLAAIGDTTNTAARLMGAAMKQQKSVIIAETTYQAGAGRIKAEELPPVELKGKAAPVAVYGAASVDEEWRQANIKKVKDTFPRGGIIEYSGERKADIGVTVVFACLALLGVLRVWSFDLTNTIEFRAYDRLMRTVGLVDADPRIVIVGIDEESTSAEKLGSFPWSRKVYAELLENLKGTGYSGLFFDIFLRRNRETDLDGDSAFYRAFTAEKRAVLAGTLVDASGVYADPLVMPPLEVLELWKEARVGLAHRRLDVDQRLRWAVLAHKETASGEERLYPSAALALLMNSSDELTPTREGLRVGEKLIPSTEEAGDLPNEILVRFGPPATARSKPQEGSCRYVSFWRLLDPTDPIFKELEGAYLFLGVTARTGSAGELDRVETPVGAIKGVEVHARIFDTILNEDYITLAPSWFKIFLVVLFCGITTYLLAVHRSVSGYGPRIAILLAIHCLLYVLAFAVFGLWLELFYPIFAVAALCGAVLVGRHLLTFRALQRFVPAEFADELLYHHTVKNRRLEATVLLTDIRGYTTLSEKRSAVEMLGVLNEYHKRTVACYERHGGKVLTYQGDAQIVVFGVFGRRENPARDAVAAALELQSICDQLREEWGIESREDFDVGAGLCTGEVEVGRLGGESINEQISVVGETVRQTHKVQSMSDKLSAPVLLDVPTYESCQGAVEADDLGMVLPKGLTREIKLYRAISAKE